MYRARIQVTCREGVLDPEGRAVTEALQRLGFAGVARTRVGKWIEVDLDAGDRPEAERLVREMCDRLLVHPVVEQYSCSVEQVARPAGDPPALPSERHEMGSPSLALLSGGRS